MPFISQPVPAGYPHRGVAPSPKSHRPTNTRNQHILTEGARNSKETNARIDRAASEERTRVRRVLVEDRNWKPLTLLFSRAYGRRPQLHVAVYFIRHCGKRGKESTPRGAVSLFAACLRRGPSLAGRVLAESECRRCSALYILYVHTRGGIVSRMRGADAMWVSIHRAERASPVWVSIPIHLSGGSARAWRQDLPMAPGRADRVADR